jgi:hypothetical protein
MKFVDIGILQSIILEIPRTITVDIGTFPICSCLSYLVFSNLYIYTSFSFSMVSYVSHISHIISLVLFLFLLYRTYFSSLIYTCVSCCTINRTHTSHLPNLQVPYLFFLECRVSRWSLITTLEKKGVYRNLWGSVKLYGIPLDFVHNLRNLFLGFVCQRFRIQLLSGVTPARVSY